MSDDGTPPLDPPPPAPEPAAAELAPVRSSDPAPGSTPWEDQGRLGIATAFVETTRQVLITPTAFFREMTASGRVGSALAYGVVVGLVGVVASSLYLYVFRASLGPALRSFDEQDVVSRLFPAIRSGFALAGQIVFAPFGIVIRLFVAAAIVHLVLLLMGGAKGFETTLRVMAYGEAPAILCILPICGELASFPYRVVVVIIGLSEAHGVSRGAAALAVLLPLLLTCCCCAGLFGLAGYFFAQMGGRRRPKEPKASSAARRRRLAERLRRPRPGEARGKPACGPGRVRCPSGWSSGRSDWPPPWPCVCSISTVWASASASSRPSRVARV